MACLPSLSLRRLPAIALFVSALAPLPSQAMFGEDPFAQALKYTVEIKSTIRWPLMEEKKGTAKGAGFLVDRQRGWIMTNAHVAGRSPSSLSLNFYGEDSVSAEKVYVDPYLDVAIVRIDPASIPAFAQEAKISRCDALPEIGTPVVAMGHPGGFSFTATKGVISGVTARMSTEFLQTDAPINPGNSGGPLISQDTGEIVGINTAIIKGSQNTNFAVASKYACSILGLLRENKDPSPLSNGWVLVKELNEPKQARIAAIRDGLSAMGALPADVFVSVGPKGVRPKNETQLVDALRGLDSAEIIVRRGGADVSISGPIPKEPPVVSQKGLVISGALFGPVEANFQSEVRSGSIMVHFVDEGGIAENAEISKGDFLASFDGQEPQSLAELATMVAAAKEKGSATLLLRRVNASSSGLFGYVERSLPIRDSFWVNASHPFGEFPAP